MAVKSILTIQMDYGRAKRQAQELREIANDLNNEAERLQNQLAVIRNNWKGDSANLYIQKLTRLINKMRCTAKRLRAAADTIEATAKRVKLADERARAIAMSSGGGRHG